MMRIAISYVVLVALFGIGSYAVLAWGADLQPPSGSGVTAGAAKAVPAAPKTADPFRLLLLQVVLIVAAARLAGMAVRRFGQPAVIGEMAAGILLGPSFFGMLLPGWQQSIFPAASMGGLSILSQVGVILFLFIVGLDLDLDGVRRKAHAAVLVSHASIVVPFFLGLSLSVFLFPSLAPPHIAFLPFALFIGVAMSITAFPVLVRIIEERGLERTSVGTTAITCAAVDDATAWCLLAIVVAIVRSSSPWNAAVVVVLAVLFVLTMLYVVKPLVSRIVAARGDAKPGPTFVAAVLAFLFASALLSDLIGVHALFGAFLAGVVLSANETLRATLRERLGSFSSVFLLPLFFASTGLRTQIGLLHRWQDWAMCAAIIAVAVAGKMGASALAARWTGMGWRDSLAVGALMNTRGLVELIVLNLGYDLGILPPRIFAMLVIMALATTVMTGPLLTLIERWKPRELLTPEPAA